MAWEEYSAEVREAFFDMHPWARVHRAEITEDGTVYLHAGGAYPIVFSRFANSYEETD